MPFQRAAPVPWLGVGGGAVFFVCVLCLSFAFGWLYDASGSVWPCLVMHVLANAWNPAVIRGAWSCLPVKPLFAPLRELVGPLLAVIVLWRAGAFREWKSAAPLEASAREARLTP